MSAPVKWWIQSDRPLTEDLDPDSAPTGGESIADLRTAQTGKETTR